MSNTVSVYHSLDVKEKIINHSSYPELVYSRISTLSLIIRQVEKEGVGLIFCRHESLVKDIRVSAGREKITVIEASQLTSINKINSKLFLIMLNPVDTVKVSELNAIVRKVTATGISLKWISILQQPSFHQLFKWELKYN